MSAPPHTRLMSLAHVGSAAPSLTSWTHVGSATPSFRELGSHRLRHTLLLRPSSCRLCRGLFLQAPLTSAPPHPPFISPAHVGSAAPSLRTSLMLASPCPPLMSWTHVSSAAPSFLELGSHWLCRTLLLRTQLVSASLRPPFTSIAHFLFQVPFMLTLLIYCI